MMLLKLKTLELEGFRSFREKAVFTFPDSGMILISGRYADREISSGSGKSTPAIAIAFVLGYSSLPATELKNRDSKSLSVKLVLTDGTADYTIIRNPKLKVITPEFEREGKAAEECLSHLLKIPSNLAEAITYREQRTHGRFMNSTDSQNKEFLGTLLGISAIEDASEALKSELDALLSRKESLERTIEDRQSMLSTLTVSDEEISIAQQNFATTGLRAQELAAPDRIKELQAELVSAKAHKDNAYSAIRMSDSAKNTNVMLRNNIIQLQQTIEMLKASICPTCRREWMEGQNTLNEKESQKQSMLDKMAANVSIINNAQPIMDSMPTLERQYQDLVTQIGQLQGPIADANTAHQMARSTLQKVTERKNSVEAVKNGITDYQAQIVGLITEIEVAKHAVEILSRNGFLGAIFDEVLIDIESRSNEMMAQIPNIDSYTLNISSTSVTKTGNAKKTINVRLHHDGKEIHPKTLSGGQMVSAELCTDLSVSEAIRARSGSPLGWIVLDEALDGLDLETKKAALSIIRSKIKGQILVIDHSTEVKEQFETVIEIEFDGRESKIINN